MLQENPSLTPYLPEAISIAYELGLDLAVCETALNYDAFPNHCPYTLEQILDAAFLPGSEQK